jgi:hypothetical protein
MTANQATCAREGCNRLIPPGVDHQTCTAVCGLLYRHRIEAHRIAAVIGPGLAADQLRDAAADFIEAFDDLIQLRRNVRLQAQAAGISDTAWARIVRGEHQ